MCKFVSGYVSRCGEIYCIPEYTDSHEMIARVFNLRDSECAWYRENLAKWECTPPDDVSAWTDFSQWTVRADENDTPSWFDAEKIRDHVSKEVSRMFVRDARGILLGGCWIFDGKDASAKGILNGRVVAVINGANLSRANLSSANLSSANLDSANLSSANLSSANLYGANLYGANLDSANLSRANLYGANLYGANNADLPSGWKKLDSGIVVRE